MKVCFKDDYYNDMEVLAENVENEQEAICVIMKFLDDHNYKSYYQRVWYDEDMMMYKVDVGSHSQFFYYG